MTRAATSWPCRHGRPTARRLRVRWLALIETHRSTLAGRFQGIGGVEIGWSHYEPVGTAWTKRGALRVAEREIGRRS